eukprot:TRINITY_DN1783_c0_g1_i3.p1 TRINITY_DN1783_c0_g1~~TRINITY_DN1783_c0_g1_i3.p1  ORF type:complete len:132 (+),score=2.46 TRINITY_DN1783_c0_g1_i3:256-651(+)
MASFELLQRNQPSSMQFSIQRNRIRRKLNSHPHVLKIFVKRQMHRRNVGVDNIFFFLSVQNRNGAFARQNIIEVFVSSHIGIFEFEPRQTQGMAIDNTFELLSCVNSSKLGLVEESISLSLDLFRGCERLE